MLCWQKTGKPNGMELSYPKIVQKGAMKKEQKYKFKADPRKEEYPVDNNPILGKFNFQPFKKRI